MIPADDKASFSFLMHSLIQSRRKLEQICCCEMHRRVAVLVAALPLIGSCWPFARGSWPFARSGWTRAGCRWPRAGCRWPRPTSRAHALALHSGRGRPRVRKPLCAQRIGAPEGLTSRELPQSRGRGAAHDARMPQGRLAGARRRSAAFARPRYIGSAERVAHRHRPCLWERVAARSRHGAFLLLRFGLCFR